MYVKLCSYTHTCIHVRIVTPIKKIFLMSRSDNDWIYDQLVNFFLDKTELAPNKNRVAFIIKSNIQFEETVYGQNFSLLRRTVWLLRRGQTDGRTDRQTDGQTEYQNLIPLL